MCVSFDITVMMFVSKNEIDERQIFLFYCQSITIATVLDIVNQDLEYLTVNRLGNCEI